MGASAFASLVMVVFPRDVDLAREACMSPTKFKENFRAVTGLSLTRYVRRARPGGRWSGEACEGSLPWGHA